MSQVLETPIKSVNDKNFYRLIKLENGLKVLLIQHPKENPGSEKLAALNLSIDVGGYDDPRNVLGLSHFLEHMVFMGSKKYPKENEFHEFISSNGGSTNASTGFMETTFYFSCTEEAFEGAIDRFSLFFIDPLMLEDAIERELDSIESEVKMRANTDFIRLLQSYYADVHDDHPARVFIPGNLETLKKNRTNAELYQLVHQHRRNFYVANRMLMAVESSASLDDLQSTVEKYFKDIQPGTAREEFAEDEYKKIFKPQYFDKIHYMKPVADTRTLIISWPLPPQHKHYKTKPGVYVGKLLNSEHPGGVISYLKKKLLITSMYADLENFLFGKKSLITSLKLSIQMTSKGGRKIEEILEGIFSYLMLILETPMEKHKEIYENWQIIAENNFRFSESDSASYNTSSAVNNMLLYDDIDILRGNTLYLNYNEEIIRNLFEYFKEPNFNIRIINYEEEIEYDQIEPFFGSHFKKVDLYESLKKVWDERKILEELLLPQKNEYLSSDFHIFSDIDRVEKTEFPEKIFENEVAESWHKIDHVFKIPKAFIYVKMQSPLASNSSFNNVLLKILVMIVNRFLSEKYELASFAGLKFSLSSLKDGIELKIYGYNEKIKIFTDKLTKDLKNIHEFFDETIFDVYKTEISENNKSALLEGYFTTKLLDSLSIQNVYNHYESYNVIRNITYEHLEKFIEKFFKKLRIKILIQGNVVKEEAMEITSIILNNINAEPLDNIASTSHLNYQLPLGRTALKIKSFQKDDKNSSVYDCYDLGERSATKDALVCLLVALLEEPVFDILRTKEQLAYSVGINQYERDHSQYIAIIVKGQEDKYSSQFISERIRNFVINDMKTIIENLDDEKFLKFKEAKIREYRVPFSTLSNEASYNSEQVFDENVTIFDEYEKFAVVLESITKQDLIDFYMKKFIIEQHRNLNVQVVGNSDVDDLTMKFITEKTENEDLIIENIDDFKNTLQLYPKYVKNYNNQ